MKLKTFSIILLVIATVTACNNKGQKNQMIHQDTIPVKIMPVVQDTTSPVFKTSGYFTTDNETPLSFKNGGIIHKIYVREGDPIKKGQVLSTIYAAEIQSSAKQAELAYEKAKRDYQRASNLYKDSVATLEQMQNAKTAMGVSRQQKAAVDFNKQQSEIRALHDGYVLQRYLHEGQMAGPGTPVLLVNNSTKNGWIFKTGVSDFQWASLKVGDSAHVTTDAAPGSVLKATVFKKGEGVDSETGAFTIQLSIKNAAELPLASGLFGKASIYPSLQLEGWRIPYSALLDGGEGEGYVFITNDKKRAKEVKVKISHIEHGNVVIDSGLEHSHFLIISGSAYLKDGSSIKVVND